MSEQTGHRHVWLQAAGPSEAATLLACLGPSPQLVTVDAHRRARGPYSAAGALLRRLVPRIMVSRPDLVQTHDVEVLTAAPELSRILTSRRETLTSTAEPKSRTRYYPQSHTTRISHGITTLVKGYFDAEQAGTLVVAHAEHADQTDLDWLRIMLRRVDPARLRIVVCTGESGPAEPLREALGTYADVVRVDDEPGREPGTAAGRDSGSQDLPDDNLPDDNLSDDPKRVRALAQEFVAMDCVSDDAVLRAAYQAVPAAERARLHDARAEQLEHRDELSLRLGALLHHRLHGSDPLGVGRDALDFALQHCILMGFYDAVLEHGRRLLDLTDWQTEPERCFLATTKMATALSVMARADEALTLYDAACAASPSPSVHMQSAYGRAMLYTRYFEPERRDLTLAKAWINNAIAIAVWIPDEKRKAYNVTFNENGLALIEMNLGDPDKALRIVEDGLARLDARLSVEEQGQHRWVLRYNRAQLIGRMGRLEPAIADYGDVIATDPNHSDYYFERAALLRQAGHLERALADYDTLVRLALPYPESFYNRGDLRAELGDTEGALEDFSYVLELDPDYLDAAINRAALRYEAGDAAGAAADVAAGLAISPTDPHLLCLRALLAIDEGQPDQARADFDHALTVDPSMAAAWVNLAALHYEQGDPGSAVLCYDRALALTDDPEVARDRQRAHAELVGASGAAV